eukprot:m.34181 g.34181  ORF g.34181 m.34181 type:complete len:320 (-) comp16941_c0_seq1:24-983(-)
MAAFQFVVCVTSFAVVSVLGSDGGILNIPTKTIAPGVELPMAGLGTWQYNESEAKDAVLTALNLGYTHIDTALGYYNQQGIGEAVIESKRDRSSFFVTSKIPGGLNYSAATAALELSISQLQMTYVDLMLVHYPATWGNVGGKEMRQEGWRALEDFHKSGKARAIGISHFCEQHIKDIMEIATVKPAVNQVQFHVGMGGDGPNGTDSRDYCNAQDITYESFSPLCGPCGEANHMELINGTLVTGIGTKYGKSGAQVSLKWQVQQGIPVIPKTSNPKHMLENVDLFTWTLSDEDMTTLTAAKTPDVAGTAPGYSGDCQVP